MSYPTTYTDEQLLSLLLESDQDAFTALYSRYHAGIYRYLLTFVKIPSIAEDLTQEVFIRIWEARLRLKVQYSFTAYIYRSSRNAAIDQLKKIATDRKLLHEIIRYADSCLPETDPLLAKEYRQIYQEAIGTLTKQGQTVFQLCREEGKSYEEAAGILGISRHTVKEHMTKSLRSLRHFLLKRSEAALELILLYILF